jgi:hypothetical protein
LKRGPFSSSRERHAPSASVVDRKYDIAQK